MFLWMLELGAWSFSNLAQKAKKLCIAFVSDTSQVNALGSGRSVAW
jgi:hypothetical protein